MSLCIAPFQTPVDLNQSSLRIATLAFTCTTCAVAISMPVQHRKHDSDIDDEKLAAAKAFLEQHLKGAAGDSSAATAADRISSKGREKSSSQLKEQPAGSLPPGTPALSQDDYFEKSAEFTAWLQETKHQYFNGKQVVSAGRAVLRLSLSSLLVVVAEYDQLYVGSMTL